MQTTFTLTQLMDPQIAESEKILRACVHCGFCTATCPTYALLGDELDSPRGRIYLIKEMLENDRAGRQEEVVKHIDRCLSCLVLHDHLSVRRALHASGRPRPRPHREDLQAPDRRPRDPRPAGACSDRPGVVPAGGGRRQVGAAFGTGAACDGLTRMAAMLQLTPRSQAGAAVRPPRQGLSGGGDKARPGRAAGRLHRPVLGHRPTRPRSGC